ncbi:MAG: HAMP domain-containing protein [Blastocatellia bacterium]|nr:HAMP domain-containing protein [Blastocatellia bacterium]
MKLNIRNKLTIFAALLIFIPLSLSGIVIIFMVRSSIEDNAQKSIEKDARLAEKIFKGRQQVIKEIAQNLAQTIAAENLIESAETPINATSAAEKDATKANKTAQQSQVKGQKRLRELLERRLSDVDFLIVTNRSGQVLLRHNGDPAAGESVKDNPLVLDTLNKLETKQPEQIAAATQSSSVLEDPETLKRLGLDTQAQIKGDGGKQLNEGLTIEGIAPIKAGDQPLGLVIAGILINNAKQERSVADEIKNALYPDLLGEAAATVLQKDKYIVSTNFPNDGGSALGVLVKRNLPSDRPAAATEDVKGISYKTAYLPVKSVDDKIVGYVGVAIKESWFSAIVNKVLYLIVAIIIFFLLVAIGVATVISKRLTQPIILLTEASNRISLGELDEAIAIGSTDEIGQLAESLERMRISLKQAIERLRRR